MSAKLDTKTQWQNERSKVNDILVKADDQDIALDVIIHSCKTLQKTPGADLVDVFEASLEKLSK